MRIGFWHRGFCQLKQFTQRFLFPFGTKNVHQSERCRLLFREDRFRDRQRNYLYRELIPVLPVFS